MNRLCADKHFFLIKALNKQLTSGPQQQQKTNWIKQMKAKVLTL